LYLSGLTNEQMTADDDFKLIHNGIGFTNMVQRPTKGSADLTRKEIKEGCITLLEKLRKYQPKIAVFNGKLIFEVFSGKKDFAFGKQAELIEGTSTVSAKSGHLNDYLIKFYLIFFFCSICG
jgi:thymine-DNA glycosylase